MSQNISETNTEIFLSKFFSVNSDWCYDFKIIGSRRALQPTFISCSHMAGKDGCNGVRLSSELLLCIVKLLIIICVAFFFFPLSWN